MYRYPIEDFYCAGERVEDMRSYKPGGFHPVHLGDSFSKCPGSDRPRYRVLQKLGQGAFSTVWLAQDMAANDRGVALKIIKAGLQGNHEASILQTLTSTATGASHPGQKHVLRLLDHFQVNGPNGTHDALVTDVVVPRMFLQALDVKRILYQSSLALAYLGKLEVIHGDLHADNIAFALPGLSTLSAEVWMETLEPPELIPVIPRQLDDQSGSLPKYLVEPADLTNVVNPLVKEHGKEKLSVVIIDFGSAFRASDPIPEPRTPPYICAPEILLRAEHLREGFYDPNWSSLGDIWSLGCSIFEIVAGHRLFARINKSELLIEMINFAGPLPQSWLDLLNEKPKPHLENDDASLRAAAKIYQQKVFEGSPGYPTPWKNETDFASLLRSIFKIDPVARPPANLLIQSSCFDYIRGETSLTDGIITATRWDSQILD